MREGDCGPRLRNRAQTSRDAEQGRDMANDARDFAATASIREIFLRKGLAEGEPDG